MKGFQAHVARLSRAAETTVPEQEQAQQRVLVTLNEIAQSLPAHIIAATDPFKLNKQAPIFRCPAWAGLPSRPYHLHCERGGVPFPALALHRFPYYLFGKNKVCDYVLEHPSVSSVHAVLIFNTEHACFVLLDLGSTNGTRLQGRRVEARKPVPITVGSIIQFGCSTRTYELRAGAAATVKRMRDGEEEREGEGQAAAARQNNPEHDTKKKGTAVPVATSSPQTLLHPSTTERLAVVRSAANGLQAVAEINSASEAAPAVAVSANSTATQPPFLDAVETPGAVAAPLETAASELNTASAEPTTIHLYQLVIKHKDVDNPVSRGHNKGEVITRSKADALELVRFIVKEHQTEVPVDAALGYSPWTVEQFVAAVREYCEVSSKKKEGNLGMVDRGTFSDVIDDAAFRLRRGEVSAPVETQLGIHLLFRCD
jgi:hypothetical protein